MQLPPPPSTNNPLNNPFSRSRTEVRNPGQTNHIPGRGSLIPQVPINALSPSDIIRNVMGQSKPKLQIDTQTHQVKYDQNGNAYLEDRNNNTQRPNNVPFSIKIHDMIEEYGIGIYLYFHFLKFLAYSNLFFACISLVSFGYHLTSPEKASDDENNELRILFISSYSQENYGVWLGTSLVVITGWILIIPIYMYHTTKKFKEISDDDNDYEDRYQDDDRIPENIDHTFWDIVQRRVFVFIVFLIMLFFSGLATYYMSIYQDGQDSSTVGSLITALFIVVVNFFWKKSCKFLTIFEAHETWTNFRNYNTLKLFIFKIINVIILYVAKSVAYEGQDQVCSLTVIGEQFLFLLLIDVTLGNLTELITPRIKYWVNRQRQVGTTTQTDPEQLRSEFDISEEYLEILYRQFVTYMGGLIFPGIFLITAIMNFLEIYVDKYRLTQLCRRPHRLRGSMKTYLSFFLGILAVASIFAYPYGSILLLTESSPNLDFCAIYD